MGRHWRWWVGIPAVALAAVMAGLPVFNGWQAEQTWQHRVEQWQRALSETVGAVATARVVDYQRGLYRASVRTELVLPASTMPSAWRAALGLSAPQPVHWVLKQTLRHGWRGVAFDGHLQPTGALAPVFERLGGDAESISVRGHLGFDTQSIAVRVQQLAGAPDLFELGGLRASTDLRPVAGRPGAEGVWRGDARLVIDALELPDVAPLQGRAVVEFERIDAAALLTLSADQWRPSLAALASESPRLSLAALRLETPQGQGLSGEASLRIRPAMAERLHAGASGMVLWEALRLDTELVIDQALVAVLPGEVRAWLDLGRAFGFLRRRDGDWRLALAVDEGSLRIHGQTPAWAPGD
ncbi:hypothetical protein A6K26_007510 [Gammaproteobacteria bacterium 2W06]|nr:hypothetical protein A6K26_007510 [Gammaproteobacteria bacterium 2W06]